MDRSEVREGLLGVDGYVYRLGKRGCIGASAIEMGLTEAGRSERGEEREEE